jgi:hypothetical protein
MNTLPLNSPSLNTLPSVFNTIEQGERKGIRWEICKKDNVFFSYIFTTEIPEIIQDKDDLFPSENEDRIGSYYMLSLSNEKETLLKIIDKIVVYNFLSCLTKIVL